MDRKHIGLGLFVVGTLALLVWLAQSIGALGGRGGHAYTVRLGHAAGLVENNAVKIAGVKVGVIADIGIDHDVALLTLRIDEDIVIHDDARALVRAKSLLGEKYLQIDPGTREAPVLAPGGQIADVETPFEIDEVLNALEPILGGEDSIAAAIAPLAGRLDRLLATAAGEDGEPAVITRQQVAKLLEDLQATVTSVRRMVESNEHDLAALVDHSNRVLGDPRIPRIIANTDRVAAELADELPSLLDRSDKALASIERLASVVDDRRAQEIGKIIDDAAVATANLRQASGEFDDLAKSTKPLVDHLRSIAGKADLIDENVIRRFLQREGVRIYFGTKKEAMKVLERGP